MKGDEMSEKHTKRSLQMRPIKQAGILLGFPESLKFVVGERDTWQAAFCEEKDAVLFAAAPELLARLNLAVRYLEHPDVQAIPFAAPAGGCAELCRAAIAKATGQG